jgi:integrase
MATPKPILKPITGTKQAFIYIQKIESRVKSYISLKIKIPVDVWNKKTMRVRKTKTIDYVEINEKIVAKILEIENTKGEKESRKSFIQYFEKYIQRRTNEGTKQKYIQVLNKVKQFKKQILFKDIDIDMIYSFQIFFHKSQSRNTSNHYLKLIKQVLQTAMDEGEVNYYRKPFDAFKFKYDTIDKKALSDTHIKKLLSTQIVDTLIYETRNKFLFQIFSQGMRVSDIMLLKWSDIKDFKIHYKMFKTKKNMIIEINPILITVLAYLYRKYCEGLIYTGDLEQLDIDLDLFKTERNAIMKAENNILSGYDLVKKGVFKNKNIDTIIGKIERKKEQILHTVINKIDFLSKDTKHNNNYIFDFVDFKIGNVDKINEAEYKALSNKKIVYNRHLKLLQKAVESEIIYKSHLSRSTYASLLINSGTNMYLIAQSLGHTKIAITEKYISGFEDNKTAEENLKISNNFNSDF